MAATSAAQVSPPRGAAKATQWGLSLAAWLVVVLTVVALVNNKDHGHLARGLSNASVFGSGLDGRYVCSDTSVPTSVTIHGAQGDMDLAMVRVEGMRVVRNGSTVSMSGGKAYDAQGNAIDAQTRAALEGGNAVDLFTLGDDGQSLSLTLDDGRKARFVKQP